MSIQGLKKLQVWVRAKDYAAKIYKKVLPLLPPEEKWNLNQQLRRSSTSVSANIAEGHGRYSTIKTMSVFATMHAVLWNKRSVI